MVLHKDGNHRRINPYEHTNHDGKGNYKTAEPHFKGQTGTDGGKNWIQGAIKHPGAETKAAKRAGETTHQYMESHKNDSGKAGQRARLGLNLEKMHTGSANAEHKMKGTPQQHSADGLKMAKPQTKSYHSEPDGDETQVKVGAANPMSNMKANPTKATVSKPSSAGAGANVSRSANTEKRTPVKEGQPALPAGETEGSGSKTTAGDPSFTPMASANKSGDRMDKNPPKDRGKVK